MRLSVRRAGRTNGQIQSRREELYRTDGALSKILKEVPRQDHYCSSILTCHPHKGMNTARTVGCQPVSKLCSLVYKCSRGTIRTCEWRSQSPLPCLLATRLWGYGESRDFSFYRPSLATVSVFDSDFVLYSIMLILETGENILSNINPVTEEFSQLQSYNQSRLFKFALYKRKF